MQTNESSHADKDMDAEPKRSLDAQVAALLKSRGLRFNPFRQTHSEGDSHLPAMLVRTPVAQQGSGARHFIYGDAGSGKTAQWIGYTNKFGEHYAQRRALAVPFRVPAGGTPASLFEPAMAQAITAALFTTALMHAPAYRPSLASRLAQAFDDYLDLPGWRLLLAGAGTAEGVALMHDVFNMPRPFQPMTLPSDWFALVEIPQVEGAHHPGGSQPLSHLFDLAFELGAQWCVVMADNLGAAGRDVQGVADWAARIWALRQPQRRVEVQLYLPLSARTAVEAAIGPHEAYVIQWSVQALSEMVACRLQAACPQKAIDLGTLLGLSSQARDEMVAQAGGSPRRLIALIRDVLEAQAEQVDAELAKPARKSFQTQIFVNGENAAALQAPRPAAQPRPAPAPLSPRQERMANRQS